MTTTKDTGAGHCDKCSKIEMDSVTFQPFILCKTPSCPCHRTPQDAALPHTEDKENYERDHSHAHCFESKKPPCGQKIEHLKCCLCEKLNPFIRSVVKAAEEQAYQRGLREMKAAAIGAVPGIDTTDAYTVASGWNGCREATLTALRALPTNEQER